jgi:hypothetical protein
MEFTTHLELHSQTTRLFGAGECLPEECHLNGILTLCDAPFQVTCMTLPTAIPNPLDYNSDLVQARF